MRGLGIGIVLSLACVAGAFPCAAGADDTLSLQTSVTPRAALFATHGGMHSVNEATYAGVPMLVVPQGADQPMVARRVVELGAGLSIRTEDVTEDSVRALARRLLDEPRFRTAAATLRTAQHEAGGYQRAADELEHYLRAAGPVGLHHEADT